MLRFLLRSLRFYVDFTDDGEYINRFAELVARIYGEDVSKKPPLGENPFSRANADFVDIKNTMEKAKYHSPSMTGTAQFNFSHNSGRFVIGSGEYEFTTSWTQRGSDSIYAYRDDVKQVGYKRMFRDFPSLEEMEEFDFTSRTRTVYLGEVVVWVNNHGKFAATKVLDIKVGNRAVEDSLTFEYKIYC